LDKNIGGEESQKVLVNKCSAEDSRK